MSFAVDAEDDYIMLLQNTAVKTSCVTL